MPMVYSDDLHPERALGPHSGREPLGDRPYGGAARARVYTHIGPR